MRPIKSDLKKLKRTFILGQTAVLLAALAGLFIVMIFGYREKVIHILLLRLDASTESMASQLKANQVPLASREERGVFIINQSDGSMVIDRHDDTPDDQQLWAGYKTKLIYEMQKQKRGWIVYPDKQWWNINQQQRIIRYIPIDELGWILAAEVPRPTEFELLKQVLRPSVYLTLLFISMTGALVLWLMTNRYFNVIRRYISRTLESNLMSLGGEEKVLEEMIPKAPPANDDLEEEAIGLGSQRPSAPVATSGPKELPESQLPLKKTLKDLKPEIIKEAPLTLKEVDKTPEESSLDQLTINLNNISSPVLKKAIQKFRNG